jgi:succinate dehydrogenase/fumarate reductase-like Fe-S protein
VQIIIRGKAADEVNIKRLKARPSPPRFGRKLTAAQKARATHVCLDCGFIYYQPTAFSELKSYECPQCLAPKSRFAGYDPETGKTRGGGSAEAIPALVNAVGAIGAVGIVLLIVLGLQ